jgi:hypothetical protein
MVRRWSWFLLSGLLALGCGSSGQGNDSEAGANASTSATMPGPVDDHCSGVTPIVVSQASCHPPADAGTGDDAGDEEYGAVEDNAAGDDDDCKYHVSFTTTPVKLNENVTFNVTATALADGSAVTRANIQIESYVATNEFHVIPNDGTTTAETPVDSGQYKISPVKFDMSGQWVVRFHLFEECADLSDDSPHGHIAFYLNVP